MNSEKAPVYSLPASTDTDMKLPPLSSAAAVELREMLHGKPDRIELPGNAHYPQETLIMGNIPESVVYVGGDSLTSVDTTGKCATIPTPDHLLTFHRYEQDIGCDIAVVVMDGITYRVPLIDYEFERYPSHDRQDSDRRFRRERVVATTVSSENGKFQRTVTDEQLSSVDASGNHRKEHSFLMIDSHEDGTSTRAVAILAITTGGQVVTVRQFRPNVGRFLNDPPGGAVEEGETWYEAALREFREETAMVPGLMIDGGKIDWGPYRKMEGRMVLAIGCRPAEDTTDQRDATEVAQGAGMQLMAIDDFLARANSGQTTDSALPLRFQTMLRDLHRQFEAQKKAARLPIATWTASIPKGKEPSQLTDCHILSPEQQQQSGLVRRKSEVVGSAAVEGFLYNSSLPHR